MVYAHDLGQEGFACAFSPYTDQLLCCATAQYFGIAGNGAVTVLAVGKGGAVGPVSHFPTQDGSFDVAWSEAVREQLASVSGDGSVYLWDTRSADALPIRRWAEHGAEAVSVDWNGHERSTFLTASWDGTSRVWRAELPTSLATLASHRGPVFAAAWCPQAASRCATVGEDRVLAVWDIRASARPALLVPAHGTDALCVDWNKYSDAMLATGAADGEICVWDLRCTADAVARLPAHSFSVRRLLWSPHSAQELWSASYDMNVCRWDLAAVGQGPTARYDHHVEFVLGLDASLFTPGLVASCGWDRTLHVWNAHAGERPARMLRAAR